MRQPPLNFCIAMARQSKPSQALAGRNNMVSLLSYALEHSLPVVVNFSVGVRSISLMSGDVPILRDLLPLVYPPSFIS